MTKRAILFGPWWQVRLKAQELHLSPHDYLWVDRVDKVRGLRPTAAMVRYVLHPMDAPQQEALAYWLMLEDRERSMTQQENA